MRRARYVVPVISGTGVNVVEQLGIEEDCNEVRKSRARTLYWHLVDHAECYDREQLQEIVQKIRQLSPWYGMITQRHLARRRRHQEQVDVMWAKTKAHNSAVRQKTKQLIEKTLGGCAPIKDWPAECRTKRKPRGANWPEKARQDAPADAGTTNPPQSG
jgi:hypothetical protein